jgi:outer membrane murein-binding lipoprotein Lpp
MEGMTAGEIVTLLIGGILALAGAVSTVGSAVEKIAKAVRAAKAPEQAQNKEIKEIKERLDKLESKLKKDEGQIEASKECNRVLTKGMLALLEHGINGNNIDQMRDAKNDVEAYLINH